MKTEFESIENFEDWYQNRRIDADGTTRGYQLSQCANRRIRLFKQYKTEHESRIKGYEKYEMQAAAEFASKKPDLPNISSGENAGFVRRIARNTVQHTPNVNIDNEFDDDEIRGIYAKWILKSKIIGALCPLNSKSEPHPANNAPSKPPTSNSITVALALSRLTPWLSVSQMLPQSLSAMRIR